MRKLEEIELEIRKTSKSIRDIKSIIESEEIELTESLESEYFNIKELFDALKINLFVEEMKKEDKEFKESFNKVFNEELLSRLTKQVELKKLKEKEKLEEKIEELKKEKEEIIDCAVEEQRYTQDYVIGFGKPKNKGLSTYRKKEYNALIKKVYDKLDVEGFDVLFDEVRNKIYLKESELSKTKVITYIYDIIKDFEIVKKKFGGLRFKGLILILPVDFIEFYKNQKGL